MSLWYQHNSSYSKNDTVFSFPHHSAHHLSFPRVCSSVTINLTYSLQSRLLRWLRCVETEPVTRGGWPLATLSPGLRWWPGDIRGLTDKLTSSHRGPDTGLLRCSAKSEMFSILNLNDQVMDFMLLLLWIEIDTDLKDRLWLKVTSDIPTYQICRCRC